MAGTISNLGLTFGGANSGMTSETIDKLRKADKEIMLGPTKKELETVYTKQKDFKTIKKVLEKLKNAARVFSSATTYLKRKTVSKGEGGTIKVEDGVNPQEGKIHVNTIAKKSVLESKGFLNKKTIINTSSTNQVLTLKTSGKEYKIDVTPQMTLEDLQTAINDKTGGEIRASILNTGGDNPFHLILESKKTGKASKIEASVENNSFDLSLKTIQEASDASFLYNGIEIKRDTNKIKDLYVGVEITLLKDNADINFKIEKDLGKMTEDMQNFVKAYNEAAKVLTDVTKYDDKEKTIGIFQGDSRINSIQSELNKILFSNSDSFRYKTIKNSNTKSEELVMAHDNLADYGLELTKDGFLTFKTSLFEKKIKENPEGVEKFFKGSRDVTPSVYTSKSISNLTNDFVIKKGDIKINGVEIGEVKLLSSNTKMQNAQILASAINSHTNKTGVTAKVSTNDGQIVLEDKSANTIRLEVNSNVASVVGMTSGVSSGNIKEKDGVFQKLNKVMDKMFYGANSTFTLLGDGLKKSEKRLTDELQKTIDRINAKYETMSLQFIAYNKIISGLEASFSSVKMQIQAQVAQKG